MTAVLFYIFVFSSWALGLFSWLIVLSNFVSRSTYKQQERQLELDQKRMMIEKFNSLTGINHMPQAKTAPWGKVSQPQESPDLIPDKIKELMQSSPNHPEVEEIDGNDQILGVRFEAPDYPPVFGDGEDDE